MAKTPTRNASVILNDQTTESDDRCKNFIIFNRNFCIIFFQVDDYTSENPLDFTAGSIRPNEHAFFSDVTTMKELENDLTDLLQRFREGTLLAFSKWYYYFFSGFNYIK
jgi:hypothetical protein